MNVREAVRRRRSVKRFTSRAVSRDEIEGLLELAVLAPNHRMTQPWGFWVLGPETRRAYGRIKGERRAGKVEDPKAAEAVRRKTEVEMESLPALVAFTQRLDEDPEVREEDFATVYMGMQSFLLGAMAVGLGTHVKTGRILDEPETRRALGVEDDERIVALVHLGEPEDIPDSKPRVPAAERTRWLP